MFRVLVVDDEPAALEYIGNILRLKCPDLVVAGTAENGKEGLLRYRQLKPDLIISDVKMPVMSGLDMIKIIKQEEAELPVLLVSGYQEFEYVRSALKYGVSDYVLKPMTPAGFVAAIEPMCRTLYQKVYEQRKKLVRSMIMGEPVKRDVIRRYFTEPWYYVAVMRENGLPRRFTDTCELELISEVGNTLFVYGRDEREALYICPKQAVSGNDFIKTIELEAGKRKQEGNFLTMVLLPKAVAVDTIAQAVSRLYGELNRRLSIGVTQSIFVSESQEKSEKWETWELHGKEMKQRVERCLEKRDFDQLFRELFALLKKAEEMKYSQLYLEKAVRQLTVQIQQYFNSKPDLLEEERMFEDAFYDAGNIEDLYNSLKSILNRYWKKDKESVKPDSPEFLDTIKAFIESHLEKELTVASVCREFGLSQSYFNLIFRKYGNESFNTYLRNTRMKRAMEIMERNPRMYIKDIAIMTGYRDQFYFSRLFRAVTGMSPSEYVERL